MKKVLFLIHDLGPGGAEKVLVNLVNNMDFSRFDVTVMTLFDQGVNRAFLSPKVTYRSWCKRAVRGNSHLMKLLSPQALHRMIIKERYDIEVAYLEGPCARVISGCTDPETKLVSWIHIEQHTAKRAAASFRSIAEARRCYGRFHRIISVSQTVEEDFRQALNVETAYRVLYNTNESQKILTLCEETAEEAQFSDEEIKLVGVGKLLRNKGFDRLLRVAKRLKEDGLRIHVYLLGDGPERDALQRYAQAEGMSRQVTLLGYQTNPYKYIAKSDLFVCSSLREGFSTAATEALIVGTPVCTVEVSGMREMLGENNEYGVITENDEEALYRGIKRLLDDPALLAHYKRQAEIRGKDFKTEKTVEAVQKMLEEL